MPTALRLLLAALLSASSAATAAFVGLSSVRARTFENENLGTFVPGAIDRFGAALAVGDFNGDGADDLATGIPNHDGVAQAPVAGMGGVVVRYGAPRNGLSAAPVSVFLHQPVSGGYDNADTNERFGAALAAGDFNHDGYDDLAVGIPSDHGPGEVDVWSGAVEIFHGAPAGIELVAGDFLIPGYLGVPGEAEGDEQFGSALAVGRFNDDLYDDLAIGIPGYVTGTFVERGGAVLVANGSADGLGAFDGYLFTQDDSEIPDDSEDNDYFGAALATGDFDHNGYDDLAIGAPYEDGVGAVLALFGSPNGLIYANHIWWGENDLGGESEALDTFGSALATGDFDGDGYDDLVIAAPFEDLGDEASPIPDAGALTLLYGSGAGAPDWFNRARTSHLRQSDVFLDEGIDAAGDRFGFAIAAGDFDRDGHDDLAIGHPGEDLGGTDRGAVTILIGVAGTGIWGGADILATFAGQLPGTLQESQELGAALATGDFDGDGHSDLAIGIPGRDVTGVGADVGRESVVYGALFSDGLYFGTPGTWSAFTP